MISARLPKHFLLTALAVFLAGCSTVTFTSYEQGMERTPKSKDFLIQVLEDEEGYMIIGTVSYQDSGSSSIWNGWTDNQALIREMKEENIQRLVEKIREVGGEALIGVKHDIWSGGGGGGSVGLGVGYGCGNVGVGLGTQLFGSNPRIIVNSYGMVGVADAKEGSDPPLASHQE